MPLNIRKFLKTSLVIASSIGAFFIVERLCHSATDGFAVSRILNPLPLEPEFQPSVLSSQDKDRLLTILSQPFHYLNSGGQSYVFESADNEYVLKFFKFHHIRVHPIYSYLPLTKKLKAHLSQKIAKKDRVLRKTFKAYKAAETHFKNESALVYLHLNPTQDLQIPIEIIDRIGVHFKLPADEIAFAVQKKGILAYQRIQQFMQTNNIDKAKESITHMIDLSVKRCLKGIRDEDADFKTNFGFVGDLPLQLDVGRLVLDENEKLPEVFIPELHRITDHFRKWLTQEYPDLVEHLDQQIALLE